MAFLNFLKKKRRSELIPSPGQFEVPGVVYAVGDIHGMSGLLEGLLEQIRADVRERPSDSPKSLIFMGDYVDRGPDSRGALQTLADLPREKWDEVIFLRGNHEAAMLDFLNDPPAHREWLDWGGAATLASFGIGTLLATAADDDLEDAAAQLKSALSGQLGFLTSQTVLRHRVGNVLFCHAAMLPDLPYEEQPEEKLLWGSRQFMERGGPAGYWTVHGHVVVDAPEIIGNRIAIDTGAYLSNTLTAARITSEGCGFLQQS